jgi:hypothetical protein
MKTTITKEDTLFRTELKFVFVIRAKIGPDSTPKGAKERVIWCCFKQDFRGCLVLDELTRQTIDKIDNSKESLIPVFKRHRCMS